MAKERDLYWDTVKALAIICVVLGHAIAYAYGIAPAKANTIYLCIYSFHMPLFALVSGFFFHRSIRFHTARDILEKRIKQLVPPIFLFGTVYYISTLDTTSIHIRDYFDVLLGHLWFLWAILISTFLMFMGLKIQKWRGLFYFAIIVLSLFVPDYFNSAGTKFLFPYFLFGYLVSKHHVFEKITERSYIVFPIVFVFYSLFFIPFTSKYTIYESGYCLLQERETILHLLFIDVYRFVIGMIGSLVVMLLLYRVCKHIFFSTFLRPIGYIGRYTLYIYVWHFYLNYILGWKMKFGLSWGIPPTLLCLIYFFILFIISLGLSVITQDYILSNYKRK